jgi:hypothetical protein
MKIISLMRKHTGVDGVPNNFIVGFSPTEDSPPVKDIKFLETRVAKIGNGPCYTIGFEGSNIKRFIPASEVVDIAYELDKKNDKVELPVE